MDMMTRNTVKPIKRYTEKHYPDESKRLLKDTMRIYRQFKAEAPDIGGKDNMLANNLDMALLIFAAYEASGHRMGTDAIDEIMEYRSEMLSFLGKIADGNNQRLLNLGYRYYKPYLKKLNKRLADGKWANTWRMELNPDNRSEGFAFTLIGCPIAEFANKHGYTELMPHLCASDHQIARLVHCRLIRTHTVALGADSCDYWYVGDKSPVIKEYENIQMV